MGAFMNISHIGVSSLGLPIESYTFQSSNTDSPQVLILGGVHGDEVEGVTVALGLLRTFQESYRLKLQTTLIPRFNPDGVLLKTRSNFNGVDLNRNLPTKDWTSEVKSPRYHPGSHPASEPENQALIHLLSQIKPHLIISLHSWYPVLNVNGDCEPEAQIIQKHTGYKIDQDIGYPTPGSLGTYAGLERQMPTLTYEVERGSPLPTCLKIHVPAILEALELTSHRFRG
jgi:murein peptide amidase A